ncbi:unnamed protein product [Boreogadus saida]
MSRKKLAWANKEVETFVCILGEEDVVYDVYVDAAAIDIRPTTKGCSCVFYFFPLCGEVVSLSLIGVTGTTLSHLIASRPVKRPFNQAGYLGQQSGESVVSLWDGGGGLSDHWLWRDHDFTAVAFKSQDSLCVGRSIPSRRRGLVGDEVVVLSHFPLAQ